MAYIYTDAQGNILTDSNGNILANTSEIIDGSYFFYPMLSYVYNNNSQKKMRSYIYKDGVFKKFKSYIVKYIDDSTIPETALITNDGFYLLTSDNKYILVK